MKARNLTHIFYEWQEDVLVLNILGTPAAKRDVVGKPKGNQLKVSVKAQPQNGRATDYMASFLAKEFGVSASAIEVVYGRESIHKQLRIKAPKKVPKIIIGE
jgi:uncharacterized protein (TIGR00251 family)